MQLFYWIGLVIFLLYCYVILYLVIMYILPNSCYVKGNFFFTELLCIFYLIALYYFASLFCIFYLYLLCKDLLWRAGGGGWAGGVNFKLWWEGRCSLSQCIYIFWLLIRVLLFCTCLACGPCTESHGACHLSRASKDAHEHIPTHTSRTHTYLRQYCGHG